MRANRTAVLLLAGAGTALIWRYALANALSMALFQRPYPLPEAIGTLALAFVASAWATGRGWRVIQVAGLHLAGIIAAVLRTIVVYDMHADAFWSRHWAANFLAAERTPAVWLALVLIAALAPLFWYGGWSLSRGRDNPQTYYARFDLGLTFFFVYFLLRMLIWQRGGLVAEDPRAEMLLVSFLLFALPAIGLARQRSRVHKQFMPGYRTLGMLLSFAGLALLFGAALVTLFLPNLSAAAQTGYQVLQTIAKPVGTLFVTLIRFLFASRRFREGPTALEAAPDAVSAAPPADDSWWYEAIRPIIEYGTIAMIMVVISIGLMLMTWVVVKWLMSRTSAADRQKAAVTWSDLLRLILQLRRLLTGIPAFMRVLCRASTRKNRHLYHALVDWGRHGGVAHAASETPLEYGLRLKAGYPMLGQEIQAVIDLFNQQVYGGMAVQDLCQQEARSAWRRIRSPRFWTSRLKRRCMRV